MVQFFAGIGCFILGGYQLYRTYQMFIHEQKHGNQRTSIFLPIALFSSVIFSFALFGIGLSIWL